MHNHYLPLRFMFIGIILCFLIPFFSVINSNSEINYFNGYNLITNSNLNLPTTDNTGTGNIKLYAIVCFSCAVLGLIINSIKIKLRSLISIILGICGTMSIILLKGQLSIHIQSQLIKTTSLHTQYGYYFALLLFIIAVAYSLYLVENKY